jgi:tetratricopeptide (TPR) repeat protein
MIWTTVPEAGMQLCFPGGWIRKQTQHLGPAGKVTFITFADPMPDEVGRLWTRQMLSLAVFQNAAVHPFPETFRGSYRRGERTEGGTEVRYATRPSPQGGFQKAPRGPADIARSMSGGSLQSILERLDLSVTDAGVSPWIGKRGRATYCLSQATGEDTHGNAFVGYGLGVYDPTTDTFSSLTLMGPSRAQKQVAGLARTIFHLALFGGVIGVPPVPTGFISPQEFEARIQGFLEAHQPDRALAEAEGAIEIYPKAAEIHFLRGEAKRALWHMEEAAAAYEEARRLGFSSFPLEMALGWLYLELGRPQAAEQSFARALELRSSDPNALLGRGQALYSQQKWDEALGFFERALVESPRFEVARTFAHAVKTIRPGGESESSLRWFKTEGSFGFPVPAGWGQYELDEEGGLSQILFTKDPIQLPSAEAEFETGLLYLRYEHAHARLGKVERPKPEEIPQEFFLQSYERIADPQKVLQAIGPILRLGSDRYFVGGYAYTQGTRRHSVRILSYYETARDRLHILSFRATAADFAQWEPYVEVLFACARPGS